MPGSFRPYVPKAPSLTRIDRSKPDLRRATRLIRARHRSFRCLISPPKRHTEVPFHDVDVMEVAWHGHYVKYFPNWRRAACCAEDRLRTGRCAAPVSPGRWSEVLPDTSPGTRSAPAGTPPFCANTKTSLRFSTGIPRCRQRRAADKGYLVQVAVNIGGGGLAVRRPLPDQTRGAHMRRLITVVLILVSFAPRPPWPPQPRRSWQRAWHNSRQAP